MRVIVAELLGVHSASLELVYKFSWSRQANDFRYLKTEKHWNELIQEAPLHHNNPRTTKTWSIELKDLAQMGQTNAGQVCLFMSSFLVISNIF